MSSVGDKLKGIKLNIKERDTPLWKGPEVDGITFSLLSRFIVCRERFRLLVVEGLKPADSFLHRVEYGNFWHLCEEYHARGESWDEPLREYVRKLCKRYPTQTQEVVKWYEVCKIQFPIYVRYWSRQKDVIQRTPLLQEVSFNVPYKLPSGRVVRLRGKWDSVDLIGKSNEAGVYLQENKTKGDIDERQLKRQLTFDLQTMMYLVALEQDRQDPMGYLSANQDISTGRLAFNTNGGGNVVSLKGVRYNVIRRPLSGGKGTIVQRKGSKNVAPESKAEYYARLAAYIEAEPETYFMRWKVEVSPQDIKTFKARCLDPILENLCCWWEAVNGKETSLPSWALTWQHPYGVFNPLDEGLSSDLDEYITTGSETGLQRCDNLFPELA